MRLHALPIAAAVGAATALTASAAVSAPKAQVNGKCYVERHPVTAVARGFAPGASVRATIDGRTVLRGRATTDGSFGGRFKAPAIPSGSGEKRFTLTFISGQARATQTVRVTELAAKFTPNSGPTDGPVDFQLNGFGRGTAYLHYIDPDGRVAKTRELGTLRGACGRLSLEETPLFEFEAEDGIWTLQFDKNVRYSKTVRPRVVQRYAVARAGV